MPVAPASVRTIGAIAKKHQKIRDELWPGVTPYLWHRTSHKGFTTVPKTMPLLLKIMDSMAPKGSPVSSTYFALWCATWDNSFVALKPRDLAFAAGFGGQRAERTWQARMRTLQQLRFIDIKPGRQGEFTYALIYNPHMAVRYHRSQGTSGLQQADYAALTETAYDVGAGDMMGEETPAATAPSPPASPPPPAAAAAIEIPQEAASVEQLSSISASNSAPIGQATASPVGTSAVPPPPTEAN